MIPILRVLVLLVFVLLAFILILRKEQHHSTYRLILAFVAVGATTFFPEATAVLQIVLGVAIFFFLSVVLQLTASRFGAKEEDEKIKKRNF